MNDRSETSFIGLPVPDDDELFTLQAYQLIDPDNRLNPFIVGTEIIHSNPVISEAIGFDTNLWLENEVPESLDDDEIEEFCSGISSGYAFFIGVSSLIKYIRSEKSSLSEYLEEETRDSNALGLGRRELARIIDVRSGDAIIEPGYDPEFLEDSSDLAFVDAGKYIFEAIRFETLMGQEITKIDTLLSRNYKSNCDERTMAHIEGFKHGIANAIEMYLQIDEERILQMLED